MENKHFYLHNNGLLSHTRIHEDYLKDGTWKRFQMKVIQNLKNIYYGY